MPVTHITMTVVQCREVGHYAICRDSSDVESNMKGLVLAPAFCHTPGFVAQSINSYDLSTLDHAGPATLR